MNNNKQINAFNKCNIIAQQIKQMSRFVQNDFDMMLADNITTKQAIIEHIPEMNKSFDDIIAQLTELKEQFNNIHNQYAN
jgi:hypothetical protein